MTGAKYGPQTLRYFCPGALEKKFAVENFSILRQNRSYQPMIYYINKVLLIEYSKQEVKVVCDNFFIEV